MLNPFYQQARDADNPENPFAPKYSLNVQTGMPDNSFQGMGQIDTSVSPGGAPIQPRYNLNVQGVPHDNMQMPDAPQQDMQGPVDSREKFYKDLEERMMARAGSGIKNADENMVTRADIDAQHDRENLNNLASSLTGAMNQVGNYDGKVAANTVAPLAEALNKSGQNALAARNEAYKTANSDVTGGMEGVGHIAQQQQNQIDFRNKQRLADPNSSESVYARQFAKEAFGKDVPPETTALQMQQFIPLMEKKYAIDEQAKARKDAAQLRADALRDAAAGRAETQRGQQETRLSAKDEKTRTDIENALDPSKGRTGEFGGYLKKSDNADYVSGLIREKNGVLKNLDSRQMNELAISVNRMLGGSDAASSINHLIPHTIQGDTNKVIEWLTNDPTGTGQQEFVKRMAETVDREKAIAESKIKQTKITRLHGYEDFLSRNPEARKSLLDRHGISEEEFKSGKIKEPQGDEPSAPGRKVVSHGADLP
jgi:hypothetical protein